MHASDQRPGLVLKFGKKLGYALLVILGRLITARPQVGFNEGPHELQEAGRELHHGYNPLVCHEGVSICLRISHVHRIRHDANGERRAVHRSANAWTSHARTYPRYRFICR